MDIRRGHGTTQTKEIYQNLELNLSKLCLQKKIPPNTAYAILAAFWCLFPFYSEMGLLMGPLMNELDNKF